MALGEVISVGLVAFLEHMASYASFSIVRALGLFSLGFGGGLFLLVISSSGLVNRGLALTLMKFLGLFIVLALLNFSTHLL